jgi:hypothetical protein
MDYLACKKQEYTQQIDVATASLKAKRLDERVTAPSHFSFERKKLISATLTLRVFQNVP